MIQLYQSLRQKRWIEVNDLSNDQYSANKNIKFKSTILTLDLRD